MLFDFSELIFIGKFSVNKKTVLLLMERYNIKRRDYSQSKLIGRKKPTKEELYNLYWEKGLSTVGIGDKLGFADSTIGRWLYRYGTKVRSPIEGRFKVFLSKEKLNDLYWNKKLSIYKIAKKRFDRLDKLLNFCIIYMESR